MEESRSFISYKEIPLKWPWLGDTGWVFLIWGAADQQRFRLLIFNLILGYLYMHNEIPWGLNPKSKWEMDFSFRYTSYKKTEDNFISVYMHFHCKPYIRLIVEFSTDLILSALTKFQTWERFRFQILDYRCSVWINLVISYMYKYLYSIILARFLLSTFWSLCPNTCQE
jgi:hypothetical protein